MAVLYESGRIEKQKSHLDPIARRGMQQFADAGIEQQASRSVNWVGLKCMQWQWMPMHMCMENSNHGKHRHSCPKPGGLKEAEEAAVQLQPKLSV